MFSYKKLGKFTYHIIRNTEEIKSFLLNWIVKEWQQDHEEFPDQRWTIEWLDLLPELKFKLSIVNIDDINLREDLLNYNSNNYNFLETLDNRGEEMEQSILQGSSIGPLIIRNEGFELMDGHTRYMILKKHQQDKTYAYVGF